MVETAEFHAKPWMLRWVLTFFMSAGRNMRYVFAWLVAEAGYRTLGAERVPGYDFEDWRSIRVVKFWTGRSLPFLASEWHHTVHTVLKEYIFVRLLTVGASQIVARFVTFIFSAYWHGFYSGYYVLTILEAFMAPIDGYRAKKFTPILAKMTGERIAAVFDSVFVHMFNFWLGGPWDLYWAPRYIRFYLSMQCGPILMQFVFCAIGFVVPKLFPKMFGGKTGEKELTQKNEGKGVRSKVE
jgi:hypothetical protein